MENNEAIDLLKSLDRVEPPPFLFTRIQARLQVGEVVSRKWVLASVVVACAIIAVNVIALRSQAGPRAAEVASLATGLGIDDSNQLYQ